MEQTVNNFAEYADWIHSIKERVRQARLRAALAVNVEQLALYWDIGHEIIEKQLNLGWGAKVVERMSKDLRTEFPDMEGFSRSNLMYMRSFASTWTRNEIVQAPLGQLPWYGQLSFYMTAVDRQVKSDKDAKTVGLLLCKSRNKIVVEYALADLRKPVGVSTYDLGLPPIPQLEERLSAALAGNTNESES